MAHFKKDGSLDMRYSSSRAAAASANSSTSYSSFSSPSPVSYGASSSSSNHFKKDGTLDMRYSSSKQAAANAPPQVYTGATSFLSSPGSDLHSKKDGSLDMRYASSKQAANSVVSTGPKSFVASPASSDLHLKKDGSLDMRYTSSKQAAGTSRPTSTTSNIASRLDELQLSPSRYAIPSSVPIKKDGSPDMRTSAAKSWVADQARKYGTNAPSWVPHLKDGTINEFSPLGKAYKDNMPSVASSQDMDIDDQLRRYQYWRRQWEQNRLFHDQFETQMEVDVPEPVPHTTTSAKQSSSALPALEEIDARELTFVKEIGRGGFGVVEEASWRGQYVAIKRLHLSKMTKKDIASFRKELEIARRLHLFQHPNLVATLAYCVQPPIIVMELLRLSSLANVLHYSTEPEIEAKICDGRIKRQLAFGIADGMRQLHAENICHQDLKPQNVLVADNWTAKIGDFGLAELRGVTSSTVNSGQLLDDDDDRQCNPAGTAAYMAPELLDSSKPCDFPCDVYSFGVLLNELICEEQPYSGRMQCFGGRGPFGAANYAKQGNRPTLPRGVCSRVSGLIKRCWDANPRTRPTFEEIMRAIEDTQFVIPNGGGLEA